MKNIYSFFIIFLPLIFSACSDENTDNIIRDYGLTDVVKNSDIIFADIPDSYSDTEVPDHITDTISDEIISEDINYMDLLTEDRLIFYDTELSADTIQKDTLQDEGSEDTIYKVVFRLDSPSDGDHFKKLTPVLFKGHTPEPFIVLAEGYYKFAEWNKPGDFEFTYSFYGTGNREISFVINGKTELVIHLVIEEPDKNFAQYILETIDLLIREDSNLGYGDGQHTRSLYYNGDLVFTVKDRTSHCVGITMQTLVMAMNQYYADTGDPSVWNMPSSWLKWEPFKHCWYVDSAIKCYGARDALVKYGIGEKVSDFSLLRPADFVNYDRTNGTGHSVIFLNYLYDDGTSGTEYRINAIGFRYFSSQGSTNGAGFKSAFFNGNCSDKFTNKDCGIIKSSLVMGRVWEPKNFIPQKQGVAPFATTDYDGHEFVNLDYFNDTGADRLR